MSSLFFFLEGHSPPSSRTPQNNMARITVNKDFFALLVEMQKIHTFCRKFEKHKKKVTNLESAEAAKQVLFHNQSSMWSQRDMNPRPFDLQPVPFTSTRRAGRPRSHTHDTKPRIPRIPQTNALISAIPSASTGWSDGVVDCVFLPRSNFRAASRQSF